MKDYIKVDKVDLHFIINMIEGTVVPRYKIANHIRKYIYDPKKEQNKTS